MIKFLQQKLLLALLCTGVVSASSASLMTHGKQPLLALQGKPSLAEIRGRVTDENGEVIAGASVKIKGTNIQTATDDKGNFTFKNANAGSVLVISFLGFETLELTPKEGTNNIVLRVAENNMKEVVVTALGITKEKRKIGFATQEVKGATLEKAREPNILSSLNGRVAGLTLSNSTTLFENIGISLRGRTPLIVIDGVPTRGDSWNLNPDDVESVNVLKSNAAALLYGSLGNNGALEINTRKGKSGANGVEVSINQTTQFQAGWIKIPDPQQDYGMGWDGTYAFIDGKGGGGWYDNYGYVWGPKLNQKDPTTASGWMEVPQYNSPYDATKQFQFKQNGSTGLSNYKPIPWITRGENNLQNFMQNEMLNTTNLSVAGKSDKGDYRLSATHFFQRGQIPNTKLSSSTLQLSGGLTPSDKIRVEGSLSYNRQDTPNYPVTGYGPSNFFYNLLLWMGPDVDVRDMKNYWKTGKTNLEQFTYNYTWYNNPYYLANENLRGYTNDVAIAQAKVNYNITESLNLTLRGGGTLNNGSGDLQTPYNYIDYTAAPFGQYSRNTSSNMLLNTDVMLTYKQEFLKNFDITASVGAANRYEQSKGLSSSTSGGLQVPLTYNLGNSRDPITASNSLTEREVRSVFGYTDIGYKSWANLNLSVRNDWTSSLQKPYNSFFYPSASLGLIVSEMTTLPSLISFAKLRGAYADVSSDVSAYYTLPVYSRGTRWNGTPSLSLPGSIYDEAIKPNRTISRETGLEMKFLKNRIGFDFTYFSYLDKNSIRNIPLSQASGYSNLVVNGDIYTRNGIEMILTGTPIRTNNLTWNVTANYTRLREKVKEYYGGVTERGGVMVGERRDAYRGSAWEKSPDGQIVHTSNGMPKIINQTVNLGFTGDDWSFGFLSDLRYKNLSLGFVIDGRIGGKIYNGVESKMYEGGMHKNTANSYRDDSYAGKATYLSNGVVVTGGSVTYDVQGKILTDTRTFAPNTKKVDFVDWVFANYAPGTDEALLYDKTFVKLREATISYSLGANLLKKTPFKTASVSVVGRNLLMWTKVPFMDPDGYSGLNLAEPSYRNIGFNLNLKF